jgi:hypothetical protein
MSRPELQAGTALLAALLVTCPSNLHAQADPLAAAPPPAAQAEDANAGRLSFTGGVDVLSSYMFRGIRQDDRGIVAWPAVDVGVVLFQGDGGISTIGMNVGLWNSLHSGPTGLDGPTGKMWYESDFYSTVTLGLKGGVNVATTYTAYISPNNSFRTVKEISLTAGLDDSSSPLPLAPYGLVAVEIDGQADGGTSSGTYLELGIKPGVAVFADRAALSFPAKIGLSLNDYYEGPAGSASFGYVEAGAVATVPLTLVPRSFGAWSARGGISMLTLGDSLRSSNGGNRFKLVGLLGIALSY